MAHVRVRSLVSVLFAATLLLGSTGSAQHDDVVAAAQAWEDRFNAGDAEGIADLYAEGFTWVVTSGMVRSTREGVLEQVQGLFDAGLVSIALDVTDVLLLDGAAVQSGTYVFHDAAGNEYPGNFITVLERQDGGWAIVRHVSYAIVPPG